jgi:hypothetical protein
MAVVDDEPMPACGYRYLVSWYRRDGDGPWMKTFQTTDEMLAFVAETASEAMEFTVSCLYEDEVE